MTHNPAALEARENRRHRRDRDVSPAAECSVYISGRGLFLLPEDAKYRELELAEVGDLAHVCKLQP
jgi:hypothetical protein